MTQFRFNILSNFLHTNKSRSVDKHKLRILVYVDRLLIPTRRMRSSRNRTNLNNKYVLIRI